MAILLFWNKQLSRRCKGTLHNTWSEPLYFFKPFDISRCSTNSHIFIPEEKFIGADITNGLITSISIFSILAPCWPPPILLGISCFRELRQLLVWFLKLLFSADLTYFWWKYLCRNIQ